MSYKKILVYTIPVICNNVEVDAACVVVHEGMIHAALAVEGHGVSCPGNVYIDRIGCVRSCVAAISGQVVFFGTGMLDGCYVRWETMPLDLRATCVDLGVGDSAPFRLAPPHSLSGAKARAKLRKPE